MNQFILAFMTGLTTGGVSCLAVQGGLLSSGLATHEEEVGGEKPLTKLQYLSIFLGAKLIGLCLLGAILGGFGSLFHFSLQIQAVIQIILGFYMFATVGNLLNLHPLFRYVALRPPKAFFRLLRRVSHNDHQYLTPAMLGFGTILIPCGVTQLMMASAIASGSWLSGGVLLFAFGLGTTPLFFSLGFVATKLLTHKALVFIPAIIIAYFAITSVDAGMTLLDSPYTLRNYYQALRSETKSQTVASVAPLNADGKQTVNMTVTSSAYTTNYSTIKVHVPVKLTIQSENAQGCIRAFTIPSMNLTKVLPQTGTETVEFTPQQTGKLTYSCNMGMYTGEFDVVM